MNIDDFRAFADAMRSVGCVRLKTADFEIELGALVVAPAEAPLTVPVDDSATDTLPTTYAQLRAMALPEREKAE